MTLLAKGKTVWRGLTVFLFLKRKLVSLQECNSLASFANGTSTCRRKRFCAVYMGKFFSLWEYAARNGHQEPALALSQCEINITERKPCRI
ncbi:hypothetical protein PFWH6_2218 [Pseudomonas fluorescens WH6]|nr:hypothetical protein PFWH6_2218 [Pseudomonas fluorescens WH6]